MAPNSQKRNRCFGNKPGQKLLAEYHDTEWCVPVHDDRKHFEMIILEGAQAGLNWETILKKRPGYHEVFRGLDPQKVAAMSDRDLEAARRNPAIIRNRLKINATRKNAVAFLDIQQEFGSFDEYVWRFVGGAPIVNRSTSFKEVPATTRESDALSKDLKKRGMSFVGSTIIYAYMQAVGLVNDHLITCWRYGR